MAEAGWLGSQPKKPNRRAEESDSSIQKKAMDEHIWACAPKPGLVVHRRGVRRVGRRASLERATRDDREYHIVRGRCSLRASYGKVTGLSIELTMQTDTADSPSLVSLMEAVEDRLENSSLACRRRTI